MQRDYIPVSHGPKVKTVERSRQYNFNRFFEVAVAHTDGTQEQMVAYIRKYDDAQHSLEAAFYRAFNGVIQA